MIAFFNSLRSSSLPETVRIERSTRVEPEKRLGDWNMDELDNPRLKKDVDAGNEA